MKEYEVAFAHGLSRVRAEKLEKMGANMVREFFAEVKRLYPNRRLNPVEKELQQKYC